MDTTVTTENTTVTATTTTVVEVQTQPVAAEVQSQPVETKAKKSAGRPPAKVTFPRRAFTVQELQDANPSLCMLTLRKHITGEVAKGFLTEIPAVKSGQRGQPAKRYIRTAVKESLDRARAAAAATPEPVEVSMVETTVAVPAEVQPVTTEQVVAS